MLQKHMNASSTSSVCDFDVGFGEVLDYHEGADSPDSIVFSESFETVSVPSFEEAVQSYTPFDSKGKAPVGRSLSVERDRYHPERSKNEVVDLVARAAHRSGQIPAASLRHSSEQWSNYSDLCEAVKVQLRREGYKNCSVECVTFGTERVICYELN